MDLHLSILTSLKGELLIIWLRTSVISKSNGDNNFVDDSFYEQFFKRGTLYIALQSMLSKTWLGVLPRRFLDIYQSLSS